MAYILHLDSRMSNTLLLLLQIETESRGRNNRTSGGFTQAPIGLLHPVPTRMRIGTTSEGSLQKRILDSQI